MAEKADDPWTTKGRLLYMHQEPPARRQGADGRHMLTREWDPQDRGLPTRCIRPNLCRQKIEPRFIYPDDRSPFGFGLFLSAAQRSSCHA